jgi:hypothetical protein
MRRPVVAQHFLPIMLPVQKYNRPPTAALEALIDTVRLNLDLPLKLGVAWDVAA